MLTLPEKMKMKNAKEEIPSPWSIDVLVLTVKSQDETFPAADILDVQTEMPPASSEVIQSGAEYPFKEQLTLQVMEELPSVCNLVHDKLHSEIANVRKDIGIPDKNIIILHCNMN